MLIRAYWLLHIVPSFVYLCLFFILFDSFFSCLIHGLWVSCELHWPSWNLQLESGYVWFMMVTNNQPETFDVRAAHWLLLLILSLHFYPRLKQRAECCITSKNKNNHLIKKDNRNKIKSKTMTEKEKLNPVWSWAWWWREGFSSGWRLVMRKMSRGGRCFRSFRTSGQQCEPISS